jgi:hypothetical protein
LNSGSGGSYCLDVVIIQDHQSLTLIIQRPGFSDIFALSEYRHGSIVLKA